jgi:hypothetical protein
MEAARLLEDALSNADPEGRRRILELLREAYEQSARQFELRNDARAAESERSNLKIVELRLSQLKAQHPPSRAAQDAPAVQPGQSRFALPLEPARLPPPAETSGRVAEQSDGDSPVIEIPSHSTSPRERHSEPLVDFQIERASNELPSASSHAKSNRDMEPAGETRPAEAPAGLGHGAEADELLASADQAFRAKRYDVAREQYSKLHHAGGLPDTRRDVWAYCRRVAVVQRINEKPQTLDEWNTILTEIEAIRALCPRHWYDEYLRNLVVEKTAKLKTAAASQPAVRQASPASPDTTRLPERTESGAPAASGRERSSKAPAPANGAGSAAVSAPESAGSWQVSRTANYIIHHRDPSLARRVAEIVEPARVHLVSRWAGRAAPAPWNPPCSIYLFPDGRALEKATGQPADSSGFSTTSLSAGRVVARRINLRSDAPDLLAAVLPHEITHIVLADLFPEQPIPRWADEGMAALAEPATEQARHDAELLEPLRANRLLGIDQLMVMDHPEGESWPLYYAQSVALVRFLVERSGPGTFIEFVHDLSEAGADAALRKHYSIRDSAELQQLWLADARRRLESADVSMTDSVAARPVAKE